MEFKKAIEHSIVIEPSYNGGFIVKVGCCTLVYSSYTKLISDLEHFFKNPSEVEEQYHKTMEDTEHVCIKGRLGSLSC